MNKRTLLLTFLLFISLISSGGIGLQSAAMRVAPPVAAQAPAEAASSVRATIPSYDHAQSGMSVVAEGGDYRVFRIRAVLEDSPASEAGLLKDDIITGVNNQTATEFTLSKLNELFERPVPYKLTIRRGEQTLQLTLTPRRLL